MFFSCTHLNGCVAVEFKWFSLPVLQVHFQNIWHEKQGVILHGFLGMELKSLGQRNVVFSKPKGNINAEIYVHIIYDIKKKIYIGVSQVFTYCILLSF